jgi:peptidoglycan biosynthesis protein MviN/MurJ (putative lipid II flippase)
MTAAAIQAMALGLWASSCYSMVMRAFIAKKDTLTPTLIGICSLSVYLVSALILMGPVPPSDAAITRGVIHAQEILFRWAPQVVAQGHVGLALASSIGACFSLILAIGIYTVRIGHFPWATFLRSVGTGVVGTLTMVLAVRGLAPWGLNPLLTCVTGIVIGTLAYAGIALVLRSREMSDSLSVITRQIRPT